MLQFIEKVCIYKNRANSLIPLRTLCGLCVIAKPLGVLSRHPCRNPKPLPRGEGLCMLGWLCIVQSLWAYTPGIRAGAECGAAALTKQGRLQSVAHSRYARKHKDSHTKPLHDATAQMAVIAQMQRHKWLSVHRCGNPNG